jgi:hypothetical protein
LVEVWPFVELNIVPTEALVSKVVDVVDDDVDDEQCPDAD